MKEVTNDELARMIAEGFAGVDRRFDDVYSRFDQIDGRFQEASDERARIEEKVDALADVTLTSIKKRITKLEEKCFGT